MPETPPNIVDHIQEFSRRELPGDVKESVDKLLQKSSQEDVSIDFERLQERFRNYVFARIRNSKENEKIFVPGKRVVYGYTLGVVTRKYSEQRFGILIDGEKKTRIVSPLSIDPVSTDEHGKKLIYAKSAWSQMMEEVDPFIFRHTYRGPEFNTVVKRPLLDSVNWLIIGERKALTQIVQDEHDPEVFYLEKIQGDDELVTRLRDLLVQKGLKVICRIRNS